MAAVFEFDDFKLDCDRFQLTRAGQNLELEKKPMELLILLAGRNGHLVTRAEIAERLWSREVFVDTEHGINTAIRKIRQALHDDPKKPRFLLTVMGKGYRFVADSGGSSQEGASQVPQADAKLQMPGQPSRGLTVEGAEAPVAAEASRRSPDATPAPTFKSKRYRALTLTLLAVSVLAAVSTLRRRILPAPAALIHSIAVLPLVNLSGDPSQDYFADGMTDELVTSLAKNRTLRVVSRTSAMQYKGVKRPLPEIARELNVDGILEGSIERSSNRVHITVQLVYGPTDSHVWAESYDRDLNQAYSLPAELSQTIAREVKVATSPSQPARYVNPEAHDAYLHGHYLWFTYNPTATLPYFEKAIALQPDYAAAWSGLADTYAIEGMVNRPAPAVSEKVRTAALKAIELDPTLAEGHSSLAAWYLFYAWEPVRAEVEGRRALELDPNYAQGHHLLSYILEVQHRYAEGEVEAKHTVELDPFIHPWELGFFYMTEGKLDEAISEFKMQTSAHPSDANIAYSLSKAYWLKGMYKESQEKLEWALESDHDLRAKAGAHHAWVAGGKSAISRWGADRAKAAALKKYQETEYIASMVAYTADKEETLRYLETSYRNHDADLIFIQDEPLFNFLHSDPRYQAIVKKMGLRPAY